MFALERERERERERGGEGEREIMSFNYTEIIEIYTTFYAPSRCV